MKYEKIQNEIIEDIYDIIFQTRFEEEAKKRFKKRWWKKDIAVEYNENNPKMIKIGKKYILILSII